MSVVTELRRRRRFLRREGGLMWAGIAIVLSAAITLGAAQALGWVYLF